MLEFTYSGTFSYPDNQTLSSFYWVINALSASVVTYSEVSNPPLREIPIEITISLDTTSVPVGNVTWSVNFFAYTTASLTGEVYLYISNVSGLEPYNISIFLTSSYEKEGLWRNLGLGESFYCYSLSTTPNVRFIKHTISLQSISLIPAGGSIKWEKSPEKTYYSFSIFAKGFFLRTVDFEELTTSQLSWYNNIPFAVSGTYLHTRSGFPLITFINRSMFYLVTSSGTLSNFVFRDLVTNTNIFSFSVVYPTLSLARIYITYDGKDFVITFSSTVSDYYYTYNLPGLSFSDHLLIGNYQSFSGHSAWNSFIVLDYNATGSAYQTISNLI